MTKICISNVVKFSLFIRKLHSDTNYLYKSNSKITTCFKNGDIKSAHKLFDKMPVKNIVTWNCMLSGYVKNRMVSNARKVFDKMPYRNVVSWTAMLNGYAKCGRVDEARGLFDAISDKNVVCWNAMLSGYVKNGRINEAQRLFDEIPEKNAVSWASIIEGYFSLGRVEDAEKLYNDCTNEDVLVNNAMLAGYVEMGNIESVWKLFSGMSERDVASWTGVIRCFMRYGVMDKARELFEEMPIKDVVAWTVMIRGYLGNNQIIEARRLFDEMPKRDVVAWNSMISGYVKNGNLNEALKLFNHMPKYNVVSWNTILQGYVHDYQMTKARDFFNKIPKKDQTTWNIMICGFQSEEALEFYSQMLQHDVKPDQVSFTGLISVCGSLAVHGWGKAMHSCVIKYAYANDSMVVSSLISMYSKCGFMDEANLVFVTTMKKDTVLWNALIVAQVYHGSANKAVKLFSSMVKSGINPDSLTFLGLFTGYAHSGMVKESWEIFKSMKKDWNINPTADHYSCMIDILGRTGMLNEAYELVAQKLSDTRDLDSGMCVLHSNIYAARGMWEDAANVRTSLARRGVKKDAGCSWIEIKGRIFSFVYNDRYHIQLDELHKSLESLSAAMEIYS